MWLLDRTVCVYWVLIVGADIDIIQFCDSMAERWRVGVQGGVEEVRRIMFEASYMVFGLGDVFLGAPCAVPVNPLHRYSFHLSLSLSLSRVHSLSSHLSICVVSC